MALWLCIPEREKRADGALAMLFQGCEGALNKTTVDISQNRKSTHLQNKFFFRTTHVAMCHKDHLMNQAHVPSRIQKALRLYASTPVIFLSFYLFLYIKQSNFMVTFSELQNFKNKYLIYTITKKIWFFNQNQKIYINNLEKLKYFRYQFSH